MMLRLRSHPFAVRHRPVKTAHEVRHWGGVSSKVDENTSSVGFCGDSASEQCAPILPVVGGQTLRLESIKVSPLRFQQPIAQSAHSTCLLPGFLRLPLASCSPALRRTPVLNPSQNGTLSRSCPEGKETGSTLPAILPCRTSMVNFSGRSVSSTSALATNSTTTTSGRAWTTLSAPKARS